MNNAPTFKVLIRAVHHVPSNAFPLVRAECRAMNGTASVPLAGRSTTSRAGIVVADSRPPAAMIPRVHDGYPLYHNAVTARQITSTIPPAPTPAPRGLSSRQTAMAPLAPEIAVRLQTDGAGRVSIRYDKWFLKSEITTTDFFAWFAR